MCLCVLLICTVLFEGLLLLCASACAWVYNACLLCLCALCVSVLNGVFMVWLLHDCLWLCLGVV